jgi:hypothetical protein
VFSAKWGLRRKKYEDRHVSPFTRQIRETGHLALYVINTGNSSFPPTREVNKKDDISPATREVRELWRVDVCDVSTRNNAETRRPEV